MSSVDLFLSSVWEPWFETFFTGKADLKLRRDMAYNPPKAIDAIREAFRSSGGFYYNGAKTTDVIAATGLSWDSICAKCDDDVDGHLQLPIEAARELVATIEARPLTRARYTRYLLGAGFGRDGPIQKYIDLVCKDQGQPPVVLRDHLSSADIDGLFATILERRAELLGLLRKSVERNEPLLLERRPCAQSSSK